MAPALRLAKAEFDYSPEEAGGEEIEITENVTLWVLDDSDPDWTKVRPRLPPSSLPGLVPSSYITPLPPLRQIQALYDYTPEEDGEGEELAIKEGERLDWYEEDGEWALVGSEAGVGFVPRNYVGEEGEEEEEVEEPQPMLALAPVVVKASTPPAASGGGAGAVMTWPVTEIDKKKKKKKGTLGIGNGTIFFASESDKTPVQQFPLSTLISHSTSKPKHIHLVFPEPVGELHFVTGSSGEGDEILSKLGATPTPVTTATTSATPTKEAVYIPPPPPLRLPSTLSSSSYTPTSKKGNATALYDFTPQGADEIALIEGERLELVEEAVGGDEDWVKVRKGDGGEGVVPQSYVEKDPPTISIPLPTPTPVKYNPPTEAEEEEERRLSSALLLKKKKELEERERRLAEKERERDEREKEKEGERERRLKERGKAKPIDVPRRVEGGEIVGGGTPSPEKRERRRRETAPTTGGGKPSPSRLRTWKDRTGQFKVDAEYLGMNGSKIRLHKSNGVTVEVPLEKMSNEDRDYLRRVGEAGGDDIPLGVTLEINGRASGREREREAAREREARELAQAKQASLASANQPRKKAGPGFDWFEFFLNAGCDVDDCTRYSRNFEREKFEESLIKDLESSTLRTLGCREGDIIRILRLSKDKYGGKGGTTTGPPTPDKERGQPTPPPPNLFTNADGGLKNNTGRGRRNTTNRRDTGSVDPAALVSAGNEIQKSKGRTPDVITISPTTTGGSSLDPSRRSSSTIPQLGGFDDDAWTPRGSSSKPSTPAPAVVKTPTPPPPIAAPTARGDQPQRSASVGPPSSAAAGLTYNDGLLAQLGIQPNGSSQLSRPPSAPLMTPNRSQTNSLPMAAKGPVLPIAANQPLLAPLIPTPTGFVGGRMGMMPQMTGYQGAGGMGGMNSQFGGMSLQPQPTGYGGMMQQQQPISMQPTVFIQPYQQPQQQQQPQQSFQQPQQSFQQPQQSFQQPNNFLQPQTGYLLQPQQTGFHSPSPVNSFNPAPPNRFNPSPQPQPIQFNPTPPSSNMGMSSAPPTSSSTAQFQPTNIFASMKDGSFAKGGSQLGPQDPGKYDALRPQPTGFQPGLQPQMTGFPGMMQPQQTGFPQQQQQQMFPQQTGMYQQNFQRQF